MVHADLVFINGKVVTVDKNFRYKEAIAVKDGWIIDVGKSVEIREYIGSKTEVIDLQGKTILPAAHDAHAHGVVWGTSALFTIDCSAMHVKSAEDLRNKLAEKAQKTEPGKWIRGGGFNQNIFEEYLADNEFELTKRDIDTVTPDHPVVLIDWTGHLMLVNSKALEICNIDRNTPDSQNGKIVRDENGEPVGLFSESAMSLISKHIPLWTDEEIKTAIIGLQKQLNSNGYGSYTECSIGPAGNTRDSGASGERCIGIYKQLQDEGLLTARVSVGLYTGVSGVQSYEYMLNDLDTMEMPEITDKNWFNIPMIKLFTDGVHLDYSAWMLGAYYDRPDYHGASCFPGADEEQAEAIKRMILLAHQRGYQVGIHTIGDRAISVAVEGFIDAMNEFPRKNHRHYLIHAESLIPDDMIEKCAKYGIGISVQPGLADNLYEISLERLGAKGHRMFGLKNLLDADIVLAGGSDTLGGEYCNWRQAIQSAVTRRSAVTGQVHAPELAISVEEGIRLYTYNGAHQENCEDIKGSIEIGKVADLQVLDQDIFQVAPEDIGKIGVELTMVDGKIVYQK